MILDVWKLVIFVAFEDWKSYVEFLELFIMCFFLFFVMIIWEGLFCGNILSYVFMFCFFLLVYVIC